MKYANKINSSFSCILGEKEIQSNMVNVKNMSTGDVFKVFVDNFENEFIKTFKQNKITKINRKCDLYYPQHN